MRNIAADIDRQHDGLNWEFQALFRQTSGAGWPSRAEEFRRISDDMSVRKEKRALLLARRNSASAVNFAMGGASFQSNGSGWRNYNGSDSGMA